MTRGLFFLGERNASLGAVLQQSERGEKTSSQVLGEASPESWSKGSFFHPQNTYDKWETYKPN